MKIIFVCALIYLIDWHFDRCAYRFYTQTAAGYVVMASCIWWGLNLVVIRYSGYAMIVQDKLTIIFNFRRVLIILNKQ